MTAEMYGKQGVVGGKKRLEESGDGREKL